MWVFSSCCEQAIGSYGSGAIDIEELGEQERCSLPGSGSCGEGDERGVGEGRRGCGIEVGRGGRT